MTTQRAILFLLLLAAPSLLAIAQPVIEPITQNPNAVLLRRIWTITGSDGNRVGDGCGPVGDINGDSISDFAVHFGEAAEWRVYLGGIPAPTMIPVWTYKAGSAVTSPIVADAYGNGRHLVGFGTFIQINNGASRSTQIRLFESTGTTLADTPVAIIDPYSRSQSILLNPAIVTAGNLDAEAGDEVILAAPYYRRNGKVDRTPEIWFYQGGTTFQADTPTKILRDSEPTVSEQFYTAQVVDLDGDRHFDLVTVGQYAEGYKLKIWFGTETSPWTWTTPDREIMDLPRKSGEGDTWVFYKHQEALSMGQQRRTFTKEFKLEALRMLDEAKKTRRQVADDLGIAIKTLDRWRSESRANPNEAFRGHGNRTAEQEQLRQLQREVESLKREREILKKTLVIFTQP